MSHRLPFYSPSAEQAVDFPWFLRCWKNVDQAWRELEILLQKCVSRIIQDAEDRQDAVQQALVAIFVALPTFRGDCRFSSWAWQIAVHAALTFRKKATRRCALSMPLDFEPAVVAATDQRTVQQIELAIAELPEQLRQPVMLVREGRTRREIAAELGLTFPTVAGRLHRAYKRLRAALAS